MQIVIDDKKIIDLLEMEWGYEGIREDIARVIRENGIPLDKIRAEIAKLSNANPSYWHSGDMVERDDVLDIIDKYKAESEDKK